MKKFSMRDLVKLEFTKEEADLIMKAQRMFPELLTEDRDGFIISGEKLCNQLEVKNNFNTWLLADSKSNQGKLIRYRKRENVDYISDWEIPNDCVSRAEAMSMSPQQRSSLGIKTKIMLTVDCAKVIAMRQNNENGDLVCDYFILMEKAVKRISDWNIIRNPQKQGYKEMCIAIDKNYRETHDGKETNRFIYTTNADMLNLALFGYKSKTMKEILEVEYNDLLRDSLTSEANKALFELQQLNANLVYSNIDLQTRKMIIENTVKAKYVGLRTRVVSEFAKEIIKFRDVK